MIAMIAAIAEVFFFSAITAMVAIIWKPGFNLTKHKHKFGVAFSYLERNNLRRPEA